jgi:hypothetical protein
MIKTVIIPLSFLFFFTGCSAMDVVQAPFDVTRFALESTITVVDVVESATVTTVEATASVISDVTPNTPLLSNSD